MHLRRRVYCVDYNLFKRKKYNMQLLCECWLGFLLHENVVCTVRKSLTRRTRLSSCEALSPPQQVTEDEDKLSKFSSCLIASATTCQLFSQLSVLLLLWVAGTSECWYIVAKCLSGLSWCLACGLPQENGYSVLMWVRVCPWKEIPFPEVGVGLGNGITYLCQLSDAGVSLASYLCS